MSTGARNVPVKRAYRPRCLLTRTENRVELGSECGARSATIVERTLSSVPRYETIDTHLGIENEQPASHLGGGVESVRQKFLAPGLPSPLRLNAQSPCERAGR